MRHYWLHRCVSSGDCNDLHLNRLLINEIQEKKKDWGDCFSSLPRTFLWRYGCLCTYLSVVDFVRILRLFFSSIFLSASIEWKVDLEASNRSQENFFPYSWFLAARENVLFSSVEHVAWRRSVSLLFSCKCEREKRRSSHWIRRKSFFCC